MHTDDPAAGWQGHIGRTLQDSTPWWAPRTAAPAGAPDIVVFLLDDLGFSDFGCFGAEIRTAAIDRMAQRGVRFANYTTVPMCTPARAAFLTGKNPHAVGCGWLTFNDPGFPGYRAGEMTRDTPTLAEILKDNGYSTYMVGKWHNTADHATTSSSDRSSWPLARGFDRFYGFLGGETHYFAPSQLIEDNTLLDQDVYRDGYYCTDDWTDKAIKMVKEHATTSPGKPYFLYVAHNAPHAPLHAKTIDLARYRGVYDAGWDVVRATRVQRQVDAGIFERAPELAPHSPGVPRWDDVDPARRDLMARYMELYAAIVDNIDQNVGRLLDTLEALGRLDNTLVLITSDNGANGIGGPDGAANNLSKRLTQHEDPAWVRQLYESGELGGAASWPTYPLGWTDV
ncbi:MAG: sulfatase-like hydrolase/transferase, partial [Proteobacteria bacterium]|nr:sulfatase-like hydrolase/transferase [Pseudomonadota bacterium]